MEQVHPTRSELLKRKASRALADQGMNLLKRKRDALLRSSCPSSTRPCACRCASSG